jgi:cytochrome b561
MTSPNEIVAVERYHPFLRLIHWLVAVLVIAVVPMGLVIKFLKDEHKPIFYNIHESLGFIILWVMLLRLVIKLIVKRPADVAMPALFQKTANYVHFALYIALILQPISGFLANSARGFQLSLFGLVDIWSPLGKSDGLGPVFGTMHIVLGYAIIVLFLLHLGGVLFHHLIRRDATLYRII